MATAPPTNAVATTCSSSGSGRLKGAVVRFPILDLERLTFRPLVGRWKLGERPNGRGSNRSCGAGRRQRFRRQMWRRRRNYRRGCRWGTWCGGHRKRQGSRRQGCRRCLRCGSTSRGRHCHIRGPGSLELICDENCSLINHPAVFVLVVRGEARAVSVAHQIVVDTQVDGLAQILRADGDRRVIDRVHEARRGLSEEGNRCDVVGHVGRHRRRHVRGCNPIGYSVSR